jgi:hypothetical protein
MKDELLAPQTNATSFDLARPVPRFAAASQFFGGWQSGVSPTAMAPAVWKAPILEGGAAAKRNPASTIWYAGSGCDFTQLKHNRNRTVTLGF